MKGKKYLNLGSFASMPRFVIDSEAFKELSPNAIKLLLLFAHKYKGKNNGNLDTVSIRNDFEFSKPTLYRVVDELLQQGFVLLNAYGGKSFKGRKLPSLYALSWLQVDDRSFGSADIFTHYQVSEKPLKKYLYFFNQKTHNAFKYELKKDENNKSIKFKNEHGKYEYEYIKIPIKVRNPDYKDRVLRKNQFKRDVKKMNNID